MFGSSGIEFRFQARNRNTERFPYGWTVVRPAIIHFKNTRKSDFACITLLSDVLGLGWTDRRYFSKPRIANDNATYYSWDCKVDEKPACLPLNRLRIFKDSAVARNNRAYQWPPDLLHHSGASVLAIKGNGGIGCGASSDVLSIGHGNLVELLAFPKSGKLYNTKSTQREQNQGKSN